MVGSSFTSGRRYASDLPAVEPTWDGGSGNTGSPNSVGVAEITSMCSLDVRLANPPCR